MKFCVLVLELHFPQFFFHSHKETTQRQTFSKNNPHVFRIFRKGKIHQKPEIKNFYETNTFFYLYKKNNNSNNKIKLLPVAINYTKYICFLCNFEGMQNMFSFQIFFQFNMNLRQTINVFNNMIILKSLYKKLTLVWLTQYSFSKKFRRVTIWYK